MHCWVRLISVLVLSFGYFEFVIVGWRMMGTVHVKFQYTCGDAAGQNMVTIATHRACQDFLHSIFSKDLGIVDFWIEGQFHPIKSYREEMSKMLVVSRSWPGVLSLILSAARFSGAVRPNYAL